MLGTFELGLVQLLGDEGLECARDGAGADGEALGVARKSGLGRNAKGRRLTRKGVVGLKSDEGLKRNDPVSAVRVRPPIAIEKERNAPNNGGPNFSRVAKRERFLRLGKRKNS